MLDNIVLVVYNTVSLHHTFTNPEPKTVEKSRLNIVGLYIVLSATMASAWMIVMVSIERLTAVMFPCHVKIIFTKTKTLIVAICFVIFSFGLNTYCFLIKPQPWHAYPRPEIHTTFFSFIPSFIIMICNGMLLIILVRRKRHGFPTIENKGIHIMLAVNSMAFLLLTLAYPVYELSTSERKNSQRIRSFLVLMNGINYMVNFLLYGISGSLFRQELKMMFCGKCLKKQHIFSVEDDAECTDDDESKTQNPSPSSGLEEGQSSSSVELEEIGNGKEGYDNQGYIESSEKLNHHMIVMTSQ